MQAIPLLLDGRDLIAQAQTGTGKTAAYALPIVERVEIARREVQALVLAPTRELAIQVAEAMHELGRTRGLAVLPIYGGQAYDRQLSGLRAGVHVVVGTPGRIMDHMRRGTLDLSTVRTLVLDEADEMLDMGFVEDIEFILDHVPEDRQIALFSATFPRRIETLAGRYQRDPQRVVVAHEAKVASLTRQMYVEVPHRGKLEALTRILDLETPSSAIVFCRTKREVDEVTGTLLARGYTAVAVHGDVNQAQRERLLRSFREGRAELLIATEVAARGLDIPDVTHVFNYDIPDDADAYVHRIGRTGRMGRRGDAITFVTPREGRQLRFIEKQIKKNLQLLRLPTDGDIAARRTETLRESILATLAAGGGDQYTLLVEELGRTHGALSVAAAALHLAMEASGGRREVAAPRGVDRPTDVDRPADAGRPTGPPPSELRPARRPRDPLAARRPHELPAAGRAGERGMTRLHIDAGRRQGLRPGDVVRAFTTLADIPGAAIGAIDLFDDDALVNVDDHAVAQVLDRAGQLTLHGRQMRVERVRPAN